MKDKTKDLDGGPAFPMGFHPKGNSADQCGGLTIRDYFAAKAMQAGLIRWIERGDKEGGTCEAKCKKAAWSAYHIADAMLEARK